MSARGRVYADPFALPPRALSAKAGTWVLVPSPGSLRAAAQGEVAPTTLAYTLAVVDKVGETASELKWLTDQRGTMPNALILPLAQAGKARRGEVVLVSGMSGSGIERAVVVSDGESATPRVRSLDLPLDTAEGSTPRDLAPGNFRVLSHAGEVGSTLACQVGREFEPYVLAVVAEGRWLGVGFAGKARVLAPAECRVLPIAVTPRIGARVWFPLAGRFLPAEVEAVDLASGRVRVEYEFAGAKSRAEVGFVNLATEPLR